MLLLGVIWNMVVKPVGDGSWFWGALVVMLVGVAVVVLGYLRGDQQVPAPAVE